MSDSTTDMLRRVADQISANPWSWDQSQWQKLFIAPAAEKGASGVRGAVDYVAEAEECPTTGCVAGWAVAFARQDGIDIESLCDAEDPDREWVQVGAALLGLTMSAAYLIFTSWFQLFPDESHDRPKSMPALLRALADLPAEQRTSDTVQRLAQGVNA